MKVILAITPYHTHAGVANLKPATADAFAKELKIICDTYELDGVFFDDEYTALVSPPPTGFYSENTAEAAADLMFRVKRMMPDRWVVAYQLGAIWDLSGEGCEFEADDKTWLPGDYIDYVMVDYSESAWASLAQFPGLPASRFGLHSFDFNSYTPLWPSVERLEQVRDTYKTLFLYGLNPYHRSGSFDTTPGGRVVAGSNPVTPTDEKSLIFNRISRIFLLWYIARKVAVVHKWYINGRYPKISISVVKYLVVGWLLYLSLYSRSQQADNEFYWVRDYMSCNRAAASSVLTK